MPGTRFSIISDIQGDLDDLDEALRQLGDIDIDPDGSAVVINGDITSRGYPFEYAAVAAVLDRHPTSPTICTIGNHEFYVPKYRDPDTLAQSSWPNGATEKELFENFYSFTGYDTVYGEHVVGDVPILRLGTERYMRFHDATLTDHVWLSPEQLDWLQGRLEHWQRQRRPVMVVSHHVLPDTVSGTRSRIYREDYLQSEQLLAILGAYPDVFLFTSHTHWDLNLADWATRRVVPGTGNIQGFMVVNTAAIGDGYTDDGAGGEVAVSGPFSQGLHVEVLATEVVIKARDFTTNRWLKELRVPLSND